MRRLHLVPRFLRDHSGVSYIEVLVTFMLLAMVVGALIPLLSTGQQGYDEVRRRQDMTQNARVAMDKMLRELRAAESYRALSAGLLRFTMFWGDGTGSSPTVEYSLNGGTNELEYRWRDDWDFRRQFSVRAQDAVANGYAVALSFNHTLLVLAGKSLASGADVRVRYWNGTRMVELDRVLDPTSAWNGLATRIWFRTQTALAAGQEDRNYYLYYGNATPGNPPANGDNVFLDYEDGTTLDGWTRRDNEPPAPPGGYTPSPADGFVFQAPANDGYRELTKNVPHGDVEIFWAFRSVSNANDSRQVGMSARVSDSGAGYRITPGQGNANSNLRIRWRNTWNAGFNNLGNAVLPILADTDYFGRFYLVGNSLRGRVWLMGVVEPGIWLVTVANGNAASGNHYGQIDGDNTPQDHRHRTLIIRPRVPLEPVVTFFAAEVAGNRPDALAALAGPFRSMSVSCFNAAGTAVACSPVGPVRAVQVTLVVMDPSGRVPDATVTGRAYRQSP